MISHDAKPPDREDLLIMNCTACSKPILGKRSRLWWSLLDKTDQAKYPEMGTRIKDKPYCQVCAVSLIESQRRALQVKVDNAGQHAS